MGMLDLSRDPRAAGVLEDPWEVAEEAPLGAPFLSEPDLAALASNSRRNCSLFMVVAWCDSLGVEAELSLGARGWQLLKDQMPAKCWKKVVGPEQFQQQWAARK